MSEEHRAPSKIGGATTNITSTDGQPMEAFVAPFVMAQFAVFELMIDCATAWVTEPASQPAPRSSQDDIERKQDFWGSGSTSYGDVITDFGSGWLEAPMITGIDETLNDEFFERRPKKIQERDRLTLKEPSNSFKASHVAAETQASEIHSAAA